MQLLAKNKKILELEPSPDFLLKKLVVLINYDIENAFLIKNVFN